MFARVINLYLPLQEMPKKSILVASNLESSSEHALQWAIESAKQFDFKIYVLFCYRFIPTHAVNEKMDIIELKRKIEKEAIAKFEALRKKMLIKQGITCQFIMEVGFYFHRIEEFVKKTPVSWIVFSNDFVEEFTRQEDLSFKEFVNRSSVPVVIVPTQPNEETVTESVLGFHNK